MIIKSFRIKNFRSIIDTGWVPFSPDGITVFVGQNESGKSSVLDALHYALSNKEMPLEDCRIDCPLPTVEFKTSLKREDLDDELKDITPEASLAVDQYLKAKSNSVQISIGWSKTSREGKFSLSSSRSLHEDEHSLLFSIEDKKKSSADGESSSTDAPTTPTESAEVTIKTVTANDFAEAVWQTMPLAVLFNEETGQLPNHVEINEKNQLTGAGAEAARNFLQVAGLKLADLLNGDKRARENILNRANSRVSADFCEFWSQTIGSNEKLSLKCEIDHFGANSAPEKAGKPYLIFWVCNGHTQLYPRQRSQGVRWFVSFYLQLKASQKLGYQRLFLLDEPGANLHSKAQADVLALINKLGKDTSMVVYTTHSPQMIEHQKLFRVHAVQRIDDSDEAPTKIIDAHRLGAASTDTLSPVLVAMGADLSQHQVIKKNNNVILEEMSGYYYITSFWKIMGIEKEAHFIAATGVNKIETMVNMFRGWGLDFVVAIDDDKQGREVYKSLKRELFGDEDDLAKKSLIKLPSGACIEDTFTPDDFKKHVLCDEAATINGTIGDFLKTSSRSKPVIAFNFSIKVASGEITIDSFSPDTKDKIKAVVDSVEALLT